MTSHDWFIERRTEYAARALDAAELAAFADHLERCAECRDAVRKIEEELRWLPMGAAPVVPRPGLQRVILDHALGRSSRGIRRWSIPIGVAASLISGVVGWQLGHRTVSVQLNPVAAVTPAVVTPPPREREAAAELLALRDTLSIMRQAAHVMQAKIRMHGQEGGIVIFADAKSHRWNVVVHGLPAAPANARYQFWFICADGMVRSAEVTVDPTSPMMFTTGMPDSKEVLGAALTMEPAAHTAGPPRGKELAHIML
jgi:Anti-sigma-K factor rskA